MRTINYFLNLKGDGGVYENAKNNIYKKSYD